MIKVIGFDLDGTLWDHNKAVMCAMRSSMKGIIDFNDIWLSDVVRRFHGINKVIWDAYSKGKICYNEINHTRFKQLFCDCKLPLSKMLHVAEKFIAEYVESKYLERGATQILNALCRDYQLYLITNGVSHMQGAKIRNCSLEKYFKKILISEDLGFRKPNRNIFLHSIKGDGVLPGECVYIGDDIEIDILGAVEAGWHAIYYCRDLSDSPKKDVLCSTMLEEIPRLVERLSYN